MSILVLIFNNKDKIMKNIFIFTHFELNTFVYSVTLKGFVFIIGK